MDLALSHGQADAEVPGVTLLPVLRSDAVHHLA